MDQHVKKIVGIFKQLQSLGIINQWQYDVLKKTIDCVEFEEYMKCEFAESYIRKYMSDNKNYCGNSLGITGLFDSIKEKKKKFIDDIGLKKV